MESYTVIRLYAVIRLYVIGYTLYGYTDIQRDAWMGDGDSMSISQGGEVWSGG